MRYSALIPAFNAADTIAEAIRSIAAQSAPPEEIIVVDDGSTDGTALAARRCDPRVRVIRQENRGCGDATTRAFGAAAHDVVATLDADDLWLPDKMEAQLRRLQPDGIVFGHLRWFRSDGGSAGEGEVRPGWSRSTLVTRAETARRIGAVIDPPGGRGDMVDWLARARALGVSMEMLATVVSLRRLRAGSLSFGRDPERDRGYARVAWLAARRRKAQPT